MLGGYLELSNAEIKQTSAKRLLPVGTLAMTRDGRKFRYAKGGATDIVAYNLLVSADAVANHANCAVVSAVAAGKRDVNITLGATAATLDQYKDGYLVIRDGTGEGYIYQIEGNGAGDASANIWVRLRDPIELALDTTTEVSLNYNPWDLLVISATDQADHPAGIAHCAVDVSVAPYFWVQTGGPAPCYGYTTHAKGDTLTISGNTAGMVEVDDAAGEPIIGVSIYDGVAGEATLVHLFLD